jgi:hypothetical protein
MKTVDEQRLEADTAYRHEFVTEFVGFTAEDVKAIHGSVAHLAGRIPALVERTYEKLLAYDATARHFVPRQHGYDGKTPDNVADLVANHAQIQFRKDHLLRYLMHLIGHAYDAKMVMYLDMVGKIHTPLAGNREIQVPLVQMNAFMGMLSDMLIEAILELNLPAEQLHRTLRAFNKLLWVQNDAIVRHYAK